MASSVPTAVVVSAVSPGSFQNNRQVHLPSLSHGHENSTEEHGNEPAGTAMQVHRSDLDCVVQLRISRRDCSHHRNIHEACFVSKNHLHIIELLERPYVFNTTGSMFQEQAGGTTAPMCTCIVMIEVNDDEAHSAATMTNGGAAQSKDLNGAR
ncbi:hypothetical protein B0T12DRAFT_394154 [Alternaria alternata]|nr:hypothetical protein B0T12DRAFT_394154 [Alternaria alternata]